MDNKNIVIDINSILNTKTIMDNRYSELLSMINKYQDMIEETKAIYDTESATIYRAIAIKYIELIKNSLNNEFKPYIDKLNEIAKIYNSEYHAISESVGGDNE